MNTIRNGISSQKAPILAKNQHINLNRITILQKLLRLIQNNRNFTFQY